MPNPLDDDPMINDAGKQRVKDTRWAVSLRASLRQSVAEVSNTGGRYAGAVLSSSPPRRNHSLIVIPGRERSERARNPYPAALRSMDSGFVLRTPRNDDAGLVITP